MTTPNPTPPSYGQIAHERDILLEGWRALARLDEHGAERAGFAALGDRNACEPCMRYAAAVALRGEMPGKVLHLRCDEAQVWQRQVWGAQELAERASYTPVEDRDA